MKPEKILSLFLVFTLCFTALIGCRQKINDLPMDFEDDGKPYELVYYLIYNDANPPQDLVTVQNELSKVLKKKINSTIKLQAYTLAEYTSKLSGVIAAGVKFDVCFTSPDINPYITNVQREAFYPLDNLLPEYAPETWEQIPSQIWEQTRVNGHIYGSVNEQIFPRTYSFNARSALNIKDFLSEKYGGVSTDEIYTLGIDAFAFLEEYLGWLKANDRGNGGKVYYVDTASSMLAYYGFDDLGTGMVTPGAVRITDGSHEVVNQFESQEYKNLLNVFYDWKAKGYLDDSVSSFDLTPDSTWKPGYLSGNLLRLSEPHYFTSYVIGSMNAISSTSGNPARAMKFIELLRTDEEVHNILQFGVEEVHYIKDPEKPNRIGAFLPGSGYDNKNFGWGLGCEFISYLLPEQEDNQWELVKEINDNTPISDIIGFNFDASAVKQKIADCKAVVNEYLVAFEKAQFKNKDEKYAEFINRLKVAGADDIIREKQRQLNEFLAAKA
ncbi:MAG: ABC transporter substrate-binding protein [Clostridia bacterium]|nr:ABC transporter substrate-binding protein [Clostridia bacterium]